MPRARSKEEEEEEEEEEIIDIFQQTSLISPKALDLELPTLSLVMDWAPVKDIGSGTFSTVYLTTRAGKFGDRCCLPPLFAVKSCEGRSNDGSARLLRGEHEVLTRLGRHPNIVRCYGRSGDNLLLEYASLGSLDRSGPKVPDGDLRRYTCHVLRALHHVHSRGYVHCDIKPQNILLFPGVVAKVADFGLASRVGLKKGGFRGTPFYASSEAVNGGKCGPASDMWAVGCVVAEMASGRRAQRMREGENGWRFMVRIGDSEVLPETPEELSEEGKDFLSRCWARDPMERWTAEMLLRHPFVADQDDDDDRPSVSPRSHFEFAKLESFGSWGSKSGIGSVEYSSSTPSSRSESSSYESRGSKSGKAIDSGESFISVVYEVEDRVESLADDRMPDWDEDDSRCWIKAR